MGVEAGRNEVTARQHYESAKKDALKACSGAEGGTAIECVTKAIETAQEQSESRQDLYAQQDMAKWAFWMLVATIGTFLVTAVGVWFVKQTLDATLLAVKETRDATGAMMEANGIAREIGQAQTRAQIAIDSATCTISGKAIALYMSIKNSGQTQAIDVASKVILRATLWRDITYHTMSRTEEHDGDIRYCDLGICPPAAINENGDFQWNVEKFGNINVNFLRANHVGQASLLHCLFEGYIQWTDIFGEKQSMWINIKAVSFAYQNGRYVAPCSISHRVVDIDAKIAELSQRNERQETQ